MQRVTALLRGSCSAEEQLLCLHRWQYSVISVWWRDSGRLFSIRHLSCCIVVPAERSGRNAQLVVWRREGQREGGSILRGLTACCTCPPLIIMQLTLRRTTLHPRAGFVHKFWNEAETMQRHNPSPYTPKNCDLCRHMFCWEETDSSSHQSIKPKQKHRPGVTPR